MARYLMEVDAGARTSVLRDTSTGVTEVAEFYEVAGGFLAGVTTRGEAEPVAAVLICNSLHAEGLKNFRRETLLSRRLTDAGIMSHRFDYRGAGNSSGCAEAISARTMVEDMCAAAAFLAENAGGLPLGIVATRMAAIPIAVALADLDPKALVLWQPVIDYSKLFRDVGRTKGLQDRAEVLRAEKEGRRIEERAPIADQLEKNGVADVMGFSYGRDLHETFASADLGKGLSKTAAAVQVIQISHRDKVQQPIAELVEAMAGRGQSVELQVVFGEEENWWFRTGVQSFKTEEDRELTAAVIDHTLTFLLANLSAAPLQSGF